MIKHNTDKDVVLDIETLGVKPGCIVLSIGASTVDMSEAFYCSISIESCRDVGLTAEFETVKWWSEQDSAAYAAAHNGDMSLAAVLEAFSEWYEAVTIEGSCIWGNGATFDAPILAAAYKACGLTVPWDYHNERCFRTVRAMFPQVAAPEFHGLRHHALDDARHEAKHLRKILAYIDHIVDMESRRRYVS